MEGKGLDEVTEEDCRKDCQLWEVITEDAKNTGKAKQV